MDNSSIAVEIGSFIYQALNFLNLAFTTTAAIIVVYLFFFKRGAISSLYKFLVNYTLQVTLHELYDKLEELNDYDADDSKHRREVISIFGEIIGQMKGNPILVKNCKKMLKKLSKYQEQPDLLTNPSKRSLIFELRETLRHINIQNYKELLGEKYE